MKKFGMPWVRHLLIPQPNHRVNAKKLRNFQALFLVLVPWNTETASCRKNMNLFSNIASDFSFVFQYVFINILLNIVFKCTKFLESFGKSFSLLCFRKYIASSRGKDLRDIYGKEILNIRDPISLR